MAEDKNDVHTDTKQAKPRSRTLFFFPLEMQLKLCAAYHIGAQHTGFVGKKFISQTEKR
jgi:hypothetical protein